MSEGAEGRVRGACLSRWAATLNRRHGPEAATLIRLSLALAPSSLPDDPPPKSWLPVTTQLALNQAICERFYGSDWDALKSDLIEDALQSLPTAVKLGLRLAGFPKALDRLVANYEHIYDFCSASILLEADAAIISYAPHPTCEREDWLRLQCWILEGLARACGGSATAQASQSTVEVRWRLR